MIPFRTVTGRRLDLDQLQPTDVDIIDIAYGLARICRFGGQLVSFYSVAQHSCLVADLVSRDDRRAALLHDASEAYLGDVCRGLKRSGYMEGYRALEARVSAVIETRFDLRVTPEIHARIKLADDLAAIYERTTIAWGQDWEPSVYIPGAIADGFIRPQNERALQVMAMHLHHMAPWSYTDATEAFIRRCGPI